MKIILYPEEVKGVVTVPPSKSITHRALFCSALSKGTSKVRSPLISDDTLATRRVLEKLGKSFHQYPDRWEIDGCGIVRPSTDLFCGESATTLRFTTAACALAKGASRLTGGPSLSRRPVEPLLEGLKQLDVDCKSLEGFPPVTVNGKGRIEGGEVSVRGDVSSQFVSALLLIAPLAEGETTIRLTTELESKPYVNMTIDIQREFGVDVTASDDMRVYRVERQQYQPTNLEVEGDWSSASYMLAAGALAGDISLKNLNPKSRQADVAVMNILEDMGANITLGAKEIRVQRSELKAIEADLSDCPDLFPVVASLCAAAEGRSVLKGLRRLRFKESDRAAAMADGLGRMGIRASPRGDELVIEGRRPSGGTVNPYKDHRIAMALAVLSLAAEDETTILDADCVSKSYPGFWRELESIGVRMRRVLDE